MAARPFSGKTKPAQSVQVTQFRWVVREISGYSYRCSVGSESFSVSGLCSGCQRRFVRQTKRYKPSELYTLRENERDVKYFLQYCSSCHENAHRRLPPVLVVVVLRHSI